MDRVGKLDGQLNIKCQWCTKCSTLQEWDDNTYKECTSREMRRAYMKPDNPKAFKEATGKFYRCPKCGQWLKGSQLVIDTDNKELSRLGGQPILKFNQG